MPEKSEGMHFRKAIRWVFEGCHACPAALRRPWAAAIAPHPCSPWPSQHSWALSQIAVKCTVKRRRLLNGKEEAHQPDNTVQFVGLFIRNHQCVCHLHSQGVSSKDKPGPRLLNMAGGQRWLSRRSTDGSSRGHVRALLPCNLKAPFPLPTSLHAKSFLFKLSQWNFPINLTQDI